MLLKMILEREPEPAEQAQKAPEPPEPYHKAFERAWALEPEIDELLDAAYRSALPPAPTRARYRDLYHSFRHFLRSEYDLDALPAHGAVVANWLLQLGAVERRPFAEVETAARAIEYFHKLHRGDVYIDAALSVIADIDDGDDGGGKKLDDGEASAETQALPLAAQQPQH
jgi:hypothetical protein